MNTSEEFKMGDVVYDSVNFPGQAGIITGAEHSEYPIDATTIKVSFDKERLYENAVSYTPDGRLPNGKMPGMRTLFHYQYEIKFKKVKQRKFMDGELVIVTNFPDRDWYIRIYSHYDPDTQRHIIRQGENVDGLPIYSIFEHCKPISESAGGKIASMLTKPEFMSSLKFPCANNDGSLIYFEVKTRQDIVDLFQIAHSAKNLVKQIRIEMGHGAIFSTYSAEHAFKNLSERINKIFK